MLGAIDQGLKGINDAFERLNTTVSRIAHDGANGDLAGNLVDLMRARQDVRTNVASVRVVDQTIGSLLDVFA
ncbi:MAG: hypothetical protein ABJA98_11840 [Acidobacteriota bacterium]